MNTLSDQYKKDFPIFMAHPDLSYLDSTATSLKPDTVIKKMLEYYIEYSANIYRGVYDIAEMATAQYEKAREVVAAFLNTSPSEVIFTKGSTEGLNLLAYSLKNMVCRGEEIVTTIMEHHSNFVPWQQLATEKEAVLRVIDIDEEGNLLPIENYLTDKTKIVTLAYVSNVLGTINPLKEIIHKIKTYNPNIQVVVDGAQAVPHMKLNMRVLGCDFLVFSGHKMLGPTGVGVLCGVSSMLERLPPFHFGGEMIDEVTVTSSKFKDAPHKFEAGTPPIAEAIALQSAIEYLTRVGLERIHEYEQELTTYMIEQITEHFGNIVRLLGPKLANERAGIVSFTFKGVHPHDMASILNQEKVAVRSGYHCAMPLHKRLKAESSLRASVYLYNTKEDIDKLIVGLEQGRKRLII
ncbi:cysteine desulfurase [Candidatus Roizmanbacteria bacterium]|nr:cysteine desulfurase [Candidatus Roizmanbacteria bacterium]